MTNPQPDPPPPTDVPDLELAELADKAKRARDRLGLDEQRSAMTPLRAALDRGRRHAVRPPASGPPPRDEARWRANVERRYRERWETTCPKRYQWARRGPLLRKRVGLDPAQLEDVLARAGMDMLLVGASGAGKTSLACGVLHTVLANAMKAVLAEEDDRARGVARRPIFIPAYDLARASAHSPLGERPRLVAKAISATLLILDDLGTETELFSAHKAVVGQVLHERHQDCKPTIVTTYLAGPDVVAAYGAGIMRRLGEGHVVQLRGGQ